MVAGDFWQIIEAEIVLFARRIAAPTPRELLFQELQRYAALDAGIVPLSVQWMERYLVNGSAVDHFGFIDGRSQPVFNASEAGTAYPNQVHLGEALQGYANAVDFKPNVAPLLLNGSFLVIRKLRAIGAVA